MKRQTLLFSATMPPAILSLTRQFQREPRVVAVDGGQRVFAQRAADDHCIGQRIEQLEQIAAEHRQREAKQHRAGTALRQIFDHDL